MPSRHYRESEGGSSQRSSSWRPGYILLLGRPRWLLIFVVVIPLQIWRARKEARVLEAKFGEEYRAHRAGTWM